ncbi:MAG: NAD(P)H-binding protein [Cyclobacteriaceae bacterium]|nr:NAD(P)H-binding protein [Cyclobacteriaceae bacterium]
MKYAITGSAGNISRPLVERLLAEGHDVTVIGRSQENLKPLADKGAKAAVGAVEDAAFLKDAFAGVDAVYTMVPPQAAMGENVYERLGANYAEAIKANNIKYVVNLSSVGAHLAEGAGPVNGLYRTERELNKLSDANVLHLRPGFFYVNFFGNIGMIRNMGILGGNYGDSNAKMILSYPGDIAEAVAELLLQLSFTGHVVHYHASDERTLGEIARVLGVAVGKPDLPWVLFTDEQSYEGMVGAGLPEILASRYAEMGRAMRTGIMWEDFQKHRPAKFGKTKLEDFARIFATVYNG